MKSTSFFFLFLFLFLSFCCCSEELCGSFNKSSTISYQIHSFNDLREWNQLLYKGATWYKIDPHYMDYSFCLSQDNDNLHREQGCFLLSHDTPNRLRHNYNTTEDVLLLLNSNSVEQFITESNYIHIALCFKIDDFNPCDGSDKAENWNILVDELFESYSSFIESTGYNVEFILDGSGTAGGDRNCLKDKWRPWNYTWIIGDDPQEAFYSNSQSEGYDRFQIMNTPVPEDDSSLSNIQEEGNENYGKFKDSQYPFLNWEPSAQKYILPLADYYIEKGIIHNEGFKYAINIDPVQFEVFSGSRSGNAWNYCLSNLNGSNPLIAFISNSPKNQFLLTYHTHNEQRFSLFFNDKLFGEFSQWELQTPITNNIPATDISISILSPSMYSVLLWYSNGYYSTLTLNMDELSITSNILNATWSNGIDYSSGIYSSYQTNTHFITVTQTSTSCSASIQLAKLNINSMNIEPVGNSICIDTSINNIEYISISSIVSNDTSICSFDYAGVITLSDNRNNIYSSLFCMTSEGNLDNNPIISKIDIGSNSKTSLNYQNGELVILEVHGNGYCWNNERDNKRADKALCDSIPIPNPIVLNYNFGTLYQWNEHINNEIQMSPCDNYILHGVYDFGNNPSICTFQSNNQQLALLEVHIGVSEINTIDSYECGMAIPTNPSFLFDSWKLTNLPN